MGLCASRADEHGAQQGKGERAAEDTRGSRLVAATDVRLEVGNGAAEDAGKGVDQTGSCGTAARTAVTDCVSLGNLPRQASGGQDTAGRSPAADRRPQRASSPISNADAGGPSSRSRTFQDQFLDKAAWQAYVEQVEKVPLPPPRTCATGSLVPAWQAACAGSRKDDEQVGPSGRGILGNAPMTPDEALARLTDKLSSSSQSSGNESTQLQQKQTDKPPKLHNRIPGTLTSNVGKTRSLQGIVGGAGGDGEGSPVGGKRVGTGHAAKAAAATAGTAATAAPTNAGSPSVKAPCSSLQAGLTPKGSAVPEPEVPMDIDLAQLSLGQEIGRGGFGRVYAGTYQGLPVAVKMLLGTSSAPSELTALRLEVSILSRAIHPNIMKVYCCNLSPPKPFIVSELLMCSLHDYIYHPQADTRILLVVRLARGIAAALAYLHPAVLHRDLKPGNVLLSQEGDPKIADFGLARWKLKTLLSTQTLEAGSVPYLAPECFDPDNWHLTDRCDVYSMGVIMSEMLMRRPPWHGLSSMQIAWEVHVQGRRPALPLPGRDSPAELLELIRDCWEQDPKNRPSSAQVHAALSALHDKLEGQDADA